MSIRPGVTYKPDTSTVFNASAGLSFASTAAIFPPAIATSRTALSLLRASMTCPPRSSRSYFGAAAGGCAGCCPPEGERRARQQEAAATRATSAGTIASFIMPLRAAATRRRPGRTEVFAHVQRAAHLIAGQLAGERQVDRVAMLLAEGAANPDAVAVDRAGDLASHELALVEPAEIVAFLRQVQRVIRRRGGVLNPHVPLAGQVSGRSRGRRRRRSAPAASTAPRRADRR